MIQDSILAVEKVLEEMKKAEEYVKSWNASWYEQLLDAHGLPIGEDRKKDTQDKCEFERIDWHTMISHKSIRCFSFNNNGQINFSKKVKKRITLQNPRQISYDATFNVLSNDFSMDITLIQLNQDLRKKINHISIALTENILTKKFNNIEIIEDLNTGIKFVRIVKKYDKQNKQNNASLVFEAALNPDDSLEMGAIAIKTHKGNGKINGIYRFDVSRKKGICANFYSRKGVKVDLTTNPMLLGTANNLLLPASNNQNNGDIIVSNFASSTQNAIAKNLRQRVISFDSSDFNMEAIKQTEAIVIDLLKTIKGELPLSGLVERIDNCLKFVNKQHNLEIDGISKTLKLETKN